MNAHPRRLPPRHRSTSLSLLAALLLSGCGQSLDWDMRSSSDGFNTRDAALTASSSDAPQGDENGLINYAGYQALQANGRETVGEVASRLGVDGEELARFNALKTTDRPRLGEVLVLPTRAGSNIPNGSTPQTASVAGGLDVTTVASTALDRVSTSSLPAENSATPASTAQATATEPARHKVQRGETAFSIARQYNVSTKALAQWNGLGPDFAVREGQYLIIPVAGQFPPVAAPVITATQPGAGSTTPLPPSALEPLPEEKTLPVAKAKEAAAKPVADLSGTVSAASNAALAMPIAGKIIRGYAKGKNDGIDIAAPAGTPVKAAESGTVAAITKSTAGTPIVLIRHAGGILTVYGGVDGLQVAKGDKVTRGQTIARIGQSATTFLHFEVRRGVESVDPLDYLQ
jgi:murein DD-endopeptidase MepM/ murein hydrolase activator NlpD